MSDSFEPVPGEQPGPNPQVPQVPEEPRSKAMYWLLGGLLVAVIVVIGFLAAIVFGGDEDQALDSTTSSTEAGVTTTTEAGEETTTTVGETTTTVAETTTTTVADTTTTTAPVERPNVRSADEAAKAYVSALGSGDTATGWTLLSPDAQAAVGSYENFESLATEFVEGFGAWSGASDVDVYENLMAEGVSGDITVVTFAGEITSEGITAFSTLALPIRETTGGEFEVLWFAPPQRTDFVAPEGTDPPEVFPADGTFQVLVPEGVTTVKFAVNELGAVSGALGSPSGGSILVTVTPAGDLPAGEHILTVLTIAGDVVVADAVPFVVE